MESILSSRTIRFWGIGALGQTTRSSIRGKSRRVLHVSTGNRVRGGSTFRTGVAMRAIRWLAVVAVFLSAGAIAQTPEATISDLRHVSLGAKATAIVLGWYKASDGGGGTFYSASAALTCQNPGSGTTSNGSNVITGVSLMGGFNGINNIAYGMVYRSRYPYNPSDYSHRVERKYCSNTHHHDEPERRHGGGSGND